MTDQEKKVIGWREYVDLPGWNIRGLKAKIDTGARSSSLHVEDIKLLDDNKISFYVVLCNKSNSRKKVVAKTLRKGKVKSSIGIRTHRWYVKTKVRLGNFEKEIVLNLVGRDEMNFRMLIGRTALDNHFLVDVTHSYMLSKKTKKVKI